MRFEDKRKLVNRSTASTIDKIERFIEELENNIENEDPIAGSIINILTAIKKSLDQDIFLALYAEAIDEAK